MDVLERDRFDQAKRNTIFSTELWPPPRLSKRAAVAEVVEIKALLFYDSSLCFVEINGSTRF